MHENGQYMCLDTVKAFLHQHLLGQRAEDEYEAKSRTKGSGLQ